MVMTGRLVPFSTHLQIFDGHGEHLKRAITHIVAWRYFSNKVVADDWEFLFAGGEIVSFSVVLNRNESCKFRAQKVSFFTVRRVDRGSVHSITRVQAI